MHKNTSFLVGKVEFLDLYPLNFSEFMVAIDQKPLLDLLKSRDWTLIKSLKKRYIQFLRYYYTTLCIGLELPYGEYQKISCVTFRNLRFNPASGQEILGDLFRSDTVGIVTLVVVLTNSSYLTNMSRKL